MKKLISFRIYAEKGFFKKPDINDGIYLTYNMLHKPAVLGILGAITGLAGYKKNEVFPAYYNEYKSISVGIKPENDDKGNFQKTIISYNNTTGLASNEPGGNLIVTEQTLIAPSYTIFLLLDLSIKNQSQLYKNIKNQRAVYLPYLGKNDYSLWWKKEEVKEYEFEKNCKTQNIKIATLFKKEEPIINHIVEQAGRAGRTQMMFEFIYFERLPVGFNEKLYQYEMADFSYVNAHLDVEKVVESDNLYYLKNQNSIIYLY